ncbi:MAG: hypothetical protein V1779_17400 [bacterium]
MKNISIIVLALIFTMLGCGKNSDDNKLKDTNNGDIIPLDVGNTWNYKVKNDSGDFRWDLLITQKKSIPVLFPDSSVKISDVFITRAIATSTDGTYIDTTFHGYIKEKDGIVLVAQCENDSGIYIRKYSNYFKIGWVDTSTYDQLICSGSKTIKTSAGTFACIRYSNMPENYYSDSYYCKGVGLVSGILGPRKNWTCTLVSYKLK